MPKLAKEAKPEEIETHKKELQESVRTARAGAKQGSIFTPDAVALIRGIIKEEFKGKDRVELRKAVLVEAEVKSVPLRVNYPYPEVKEQLEMPPTLLLQTAATAETDCAIASSATTCCSSIARTD